MDVLVPFAAENPKTRLAGVLNADEREAFARSMLLDVREAVVGAGEEPTVLSTAPIEIDAETIVDDRPLTEAVDDRLDPPTAVVMADLALATPGALERLFGTDADVVMAPGLGGGTNCLVVRDASFHVDYHGASIRDHRRIAASIGAEVTTVDSFRLAVDVDEPGDLPEVLLHSDGRAAAWLRGAGFELAVDDGRAVARRSRE